MKKTQNDLITVIVPIYNTEKYLTDCIESIKNQTYSNLQILLVDDGSTDSSLSICRKYEELDNRITVYHKKNGGQSTARNLGLESARGKLIGFVDSDDVIDVSMFKVLYDSIVKNNCDVAICARINIYEDGSSEPQFILPQETVMNSFEAMRRLLMYDGIDSSPCDKLFKKELFKDLRFPPDYICEDVDVIWRVLDKSGSIVHCGVPLYRYLQRSGSTSHSGFSEKMKGLAIYHKNVRDNVIKKYPDLRQEANYFYLSRLIVLFDIIVDSEYHGEYRLELQKVIRRHIFAIIPNKLFIKREKEKAFLISCGCYDVFRDTWQRIKNKGKTSR